MKTKYQKTKPGYTFVELIISMVILFLAVMVIGSIFPASFKSLLKSKQVTIATTLAQQKLEECLVNPKDYETRVGKEGDFSPDHPEYSYSITEKTVTDKLKELKVEVYKLTNKGIIDAAVAQLVQQEVSPMIYKVYSAGPVYLLNGVLTTVLSKNINIPQNGIIKIDAKAAFHNPSYSNTSSLVGTNFGMWIYWDGQQIEGSDNLGGVCGIHRNTFGYTTVAMNITQGHHTVQLKAIGYNPTTSWVDYPLMIITYYPGIQLQP